MATKYLRYADLVDQGIVNNWTTLGRWVKTQGFPPGVLIGPNTRVWTPEEIEAYYKARAAKMEPVT